MKRIAMITAAVAIAASAFAQPTTEEGVKMYHYKKFQSAQKILMPLSVKDAKANYYLGLSYLDGGDAKKAKYQFEKYPEDAANISGTARVAFAMKDAAKGNQVAKDLAAKAKKKEIAPLVYAAEALTYSDGTDLQQAIQWYKDALAKEATSVETHLGLGDTYNKISGGGGEAMNNYEFITDKDPKNSLVLSRIGELWYNSRTYNSALEFFNKAKDADPNNPIPYRSLADAYARVGKFDVALQNARLYIGLCDNSIDDQIWFAANLFLAKASCEAVKKAQEILSAEPPADKKASLYGILGYSQANCGDSTEAVKNLRIYFAMNPKKVTPSDYLEVGKLWMKLNNMDSAAYYYTKGIQGDTAKNKTETYRQIADAYRSRKEYCRSAEWYNNLIEANPGTQALDHVWCTIMYYYCRDLKNANIAAERFEGKYPDQPTSTYWHARVQAGIDSEATQGTAAPLYTKWLEKLGTDVDKKDKKADVTKAYQYLMAYYFNSKDNEKKTLYMEKLRALDPTDAYLKQIEEADKAQTPAKKAPAAPPKKAAKG